MRKTKKEHYIPRAAYLRRFSDTRFQDDRKNKLLAYSKAENRVIRTNVYDSAAVNSIYENTIFEENKIENTFSEIEQDLSIFFDFLEKICTNPANKDALILHGFNERDNLKFFVVWQFFRTEKRKKETQKKSDSLNEGTLDFLWRLVGIDADNTAVLIKWKNTLASHYFVFERNLTEIPFVLPDDPVLVFRSELDPPKAVNFRFPLTPLIQVLLIDPLGSEHKEMKFYRNKIRYCADESYINHWNNMSISESYRHVYITPGKEKTVLHEIRKLAKN